MDTAGWKEIAAYLDERGRVIQMPAKKKKKVMVLAYLAGRIPPDGHYSEREFNELLCEWHTFSDPATLRRELYDYFLINREQGGKGYCLNPDRPSVEELLERCCR